MVNQTHTHPCINAPLGCTRDVDCDGEWVRNHDGIPDVICDVFHLENGSTDPLPCAECEDVRCRSCEAVLGLEEHLETCSEHPEADMRSV